MRILGLDPGTTMENPVGVALLETRADRVALLGAADLTPLPAERLETFLGRLARRLRSDWLNGVHVLVVEWPFVGANAQSALDLAAVCGVALAAAGERGVMTRTVTPQQAKRALTGHGGADKAAMMAAVTQRFHTVLPKDLVDAVGIGLTAALMALPTDTRKANP